MMPEAIHDLDADKAEIDRLVATFYDVFTNTDGRVPDPDGLDPLFMLGATITMAVGSDCRTYDPAGFMAPRIKLLTDGSITDFAEWEVWESTRVFGNIAQRFSVYRKTGWRGGEPFDGGGVKSIQFVRLEAGWRISALAWDDERPGLILPDQ